MGLLALQRLMSLQRDRRQRHRQIGAQNGSIASVDKRKGSSCQQDEGGDSQAGKRMRYSVPALPEDIWHHIHSLLPMRDAARVACLSHAFLRSWRCHPILTLNRDMLGLNANARQENFSLKIDHILRNHSGIGIKIFRLELYGIFDACDYLYSWLQVAVTPGIEELTLMLCSRGKIKYNFPCSLLSDGVRNSLRYLKLSFCAFRPSAKLGPLRNLTSMCLCSVRISGGELECFLSNAPALEKLNLYDCKEIICLKVPCVLQQLHCLKISDCWRLRVIESKARNLSSFILSGDRVKKLSLGETLQMKNLTMHRSNLVCYARTQLPSSMPILEALAISSHYERVDTPMLPTKFLFLKRLTISLVTGWTFCPSYDYFSLTSFLDASPSLESLVLDVAQERMRHESIFGGSPQLRQMPERCHGCLKRVKIIGFSSAKGLVELTCYVLKNAKSLDCLTLDTTYGASRCDSEDSILMECDPMSKGMLMEAPRAVTAIRTYIEDKVPSTVKLTVVEPCSRCHADGGFEV
uniref:At1g61320/AtMIF1 LRR domain-containing protein n=1 Tax=Arundo donax TaxID=35708 RepID=A0A0A9GQP7_ARUDO